MAPRIGDARILATGRDDDCRRTRSVTAAWLQSNHLFAEV